MADETKHPWVKGKLRVTRSVIERVDEEARAAFARDEESCGLLLGPSADGIFPAPPEMTSVPSVDRGTTARRSVFASGSRRTSFLTWRAPPTC